MSTHHGACALVSMMNIIILQIFQCLCEQGSIILPILQMMILMHREITKKKLKKRQKKKNRTKPNPLVQINLAVDLCLRIQSAQHFTSPQAAARYLTHHSLWGQSGAVAARKFSKGRKHYFFRNPLVEKDPGMNANEITLIFSLRNKLLRF